METSAILLWGSLSLIVIIGLGLIFSKRSSSKKEEEVPEEEDSQYNEDDDDWADEPKTRLSKNNDNDYDYSESSSGSGFSLSSFVMMLIPLVIVMLIGISIINELTRSLDSASTDTTSAINSTVMMIETFGSLGSWFPMIFMVAIATVVIGVVVRTLTGSGM